MSLIDQVVGRASRAGELGLHWLSNAVERRLKSDNFVVAGQTPYETVYSDGLISLRRYGPLSEDEIAVGEATRVVERTPHRVPILLVPPLAATSLNFDLLPNRSLVKFLMAWGYQVYLVDWGDPQADHHHLGLADYTTRFLPEALARLRADSGEQDVTLFGYCMGGLFALVYAGWSHDAGIRNIVTIASPIDAHQAGVAGRLLQMMNAPLRALQRVVPVSKLPFHGLPIDARWLRVPGWASALAFKLTNPLGTIQSYLDLLMNLWDRDYVTEHQTMAAWFNRMHDYPGGIVQDFVLKVGLGNQLAKGRISLNRDQHALLDRIDCSLLAIAGTGDKIVSVEAAKKVLDIVGSRDKDFILAPGGHAGVFGGRQAPATTWSFAADWLSSRSG